MSQKCDDVINVKNYKNMGENKTKVTFDHLIMSQTDMEQFLDKTTQKRMDG